jgi:hypothetical protein
MDDMVKHSIIWAVVVVVVALVIAISVTTYTVQYYKIMAENGYHETILPGRQYPTWAK